MATPLTRLSPPIVAGTLPSFYKSITGGGTTELVVPFSMNASVSASEVAGFSLRIKTTTTDSLVAIEQKELWNSDNMTVTFTLSAETVNKLVEGNFYKIQLAYYNKNTDGTPYIGYYSTASIVKYTKEPTVTISSLDAQVVNSINNRRFVGLYENADYAEKIYQYRFYLYGIVDTAHGSETNLIMDTGWCIHDSSEDTELGRSSDALTLQESLNVGQTYLIQYQIRTTNGLEDSSPLYTVVSMANIGTVLPFHINADLDYDNGCIVVSTKANAWVDPEYSDDADELNSTSQSQHPELWKFSGTYQLLRADSDTNYNNWIVVYQFTSIDAFSTWSYIDYTVQSGVGYKYGIEKVNATQIKSRRVESAEPLVAYFEDMFLYDGNRQLKIRFNGNVSSFKEVISETKKTTLGRKYPIIMRNGTLKYKEFSITGLVSYLSDPDERFIKKADLISKEALATAYREEHPNAPVAFARFEESTNITDVNIVAERNFCMLALNWLNDGGMKLFRSPQEGNFIVKLTSVSLSPEATTGRMLHTFQATASEVAEFKFDELLKYEIVRQSSGKVIWQQSILRKYIHQERERLTEEADRDPSIKNVAAYVKDKLEAIDWTDGYPCISVHVYSPKGEIQASIMGTQFEWGEYAWAVGPTNDYYIELDEPSETKLSLKNADGKSDAGIIEMVIMRNVGQDDDETEKQRVVTFYGWSIYGDELEKDDNIIEEFATLKRSVVNEYMMEIHTLPVIEQPDFNLTTWNNNLNKIEIRQNILLYDKWVYYHSTGSNYFRWNGSKFVQVAATDYKTTIKVGDQSKPANAKPIDITAMQAGTTLPTIDYGIPEATFLSVSSGVFVQLYYQAQETQYAVESKEIIKSDSDNTAQCYQDWCMKAFNLKLANTTEANSALAANRSVFVYKNNRFVAVSSRDLQSSEYTGLPLYIVQASAYSANDVILARKAYRAALRGLNDKLKSQV